MFAKWLLVPRLERIKQALNNDFLPLFYPQGAVPDVEFDYETPVPEDKEFDAADRKSKAETAAIYIGLGFTPLAVMEMLELPALEFVKPEPPALPAAAAVEDDDPEPPPPTATNRARRHHPWPTNATTLPEDEQPDLSGVQESWERHLEAALASWAPVSDRWKQELADQVRAMVETGAKPDLLTLRLDPLDGAGIIEQAMMSVGAEAAQHVVTEAAAQDVEILPVTPSGFADVAMTAAGLLADGLAFTAAREALRVWNPNATSVQTTGPRNALSDDVAALVLEQLKALSNAQPVATIGSTLTQAQRQGRISTLAAAPTSAWYASEVLDKNTCVNCRAVHGKWLGNGVIENVNRLYPTGGYIDCLGRERCRGMVIGRWRPEQVGDR